MKIAMIKILSTKYLLGWLVFALAQVTLLTSSKQSDIHTKLIDQWNQIRSLNTGYVNKDFEFTSLDNVTNGQLRQAINWKFEQLKCGYIFSAHSFFSMVRKLLLEQDYSRLDRKLPWKDSILFVPQTVQMVSSLFSVKDGIKMEEVWLVYYNACMINQYYHRFHYIQNNTDILQMHCNLLQMHDFFVTELEEYLEINCEHDNFFNIKSNICMHYKDNEHLLKNNNSPESTFLTVIDYNTKLFKMFYKNNIENGLGNINNDKITLDFMLIIFDNRYKTVSYLFSYFFRLFLGPNDCCQVLPTIEFYEYSRGYLETVLYLGKYNLILKDIFKVCTLRIVWLYLTELNYHIDTPEKTLNEYIQGLSSIVTNIVSKLYLKHDDFLYELDSFLKLDLIHYTNNISRMMEDIKYNHNSISTTLGVSHIRIGLRDGGIGFHSFEAINFFKQIHNYRYNTLEELQRIGRLFIDQLTRFSDSLTDEVLNSFWTFFENKGRRIEKFLSNKLSDKHIIHLEFE